MAGSHEGKKISTVTSKTFWAKSHVPWLSDPHMDDAFTETEVKQTISDL
jgi:hypothetical protein